MEQVLVKLYFQAMPGKYAEGQLLEKIGNLMIDLFPPGNEFKLITGKPLPPQGRFMVEKWKKKTYIVNILTASCFALLRVMNSIV